VNISLSYLLLCLISPLLSQTAITLQLPPSKISVFNVSVLHLHPPYPSHTQCFLETSIHSFPSLQSHLINLSSPSTLTSIWIILLTISPLSFCLFYLLSTSLNTLAFLPMTTRSSAIAEGPRDASCQLKSCQLRHNSAENTCTTSPEKKIEVMKLEGKGGPMCNKHVYSTVTRSSRLHCPITVIN